MMLPPVRIYARPNTVRLLKDLAKLYNVSMEEFTLTCIDFTFKNVLPDVPLSPKPPAPHPPEAEDGVRKSNDEAEARGENGEGGIDDTPETLASPIQDLLRLLFPQSDLRADLHRLSELIEETTMVVGQAKLSAEAFLPIKDYGVPKPPRRANPLPNDGIRYVMVSSDIDTFTLRDIEQAGPDANPLWGCCESFVKAELLDCADTRDGEPQGFRCSSAMVQAWLPWLEDYGFVSVGTKLDGVPVSQTGEISRAFGKLANQVLEAWSYAFQVHRGLPRQNLSADLEHAVERNRRVAAKLHQQNLESEVILRSLQHYAAILTEAVQIIGSRAPAGISIYEVEDARPLQRTEPNPIQPSAYQTLKARILSDLG